MPLPPQQRRRAPHATAGNPSLASADQNLTKVDTRLTEVDARLTKVDKGCQKLTPSTPAPTPTPSKTQQNRNRAHYPVNPASTLAVNPSGAPRTNLNKSEQTRTSPSAPTR